LVHVGLALVVVAVEEAPALRISHVPGVGSVSCN
jgi:hypothetical protein